MLPPIPSNFGVWELSDLGYSLLHEGQTEKAFTVFKWNVAAYPDSPFTFGVFADALIRMRRFEAAKEQYLQAVEVASAQYHPSLIHFRAQVWRSTCRRGGASSEWGRTRMRSGSRWRVLGSWP